LPKVFTRYKFLFRERGAFGAFVLAGPRRAPLGRRTAEATAESWV